MSKSVLFVDSKVKNYQTLLAGLSSDVEVHLLNAVEDGVLQMADILKGRTGLDAIQILSHGSSGALALGSGFLNTDNVAFYAEALGQIGSALSETGDILLYGCDVAQGATGLAFIDQLSALTGADVAASDDLTGAAALGGNWILEANTGMIEAHFGLSAVAIQDYQGLLATAPTITTNLSTTAFTEAQDTPSIAVVIDSGITIADVDSPTLATATVSITGGYLSNQDVLLFQNDQTGAMGNIVANYNSLTGSLALQSAGASATTAQWQVALQAVKYLNTSDAPNTTARAIGFTVNDGGLNSVVASKAVTIAATNDTPTFMLGDGKVATFGAQEEQGQGIAVQADGKILVAGYRHNGGNWDFALTRYNSDGSLDAMAKSLRKWVQVLIMVTASPCKQTVRFWWQVLATMLIGRKILP